MTFSQQQEFVPIHYMRWECPWEKTSTVERLINFTFDDQRHNTLSGVDLRIGIVRGRLNSGDWGQQETLKRCGEYV